MNYRIKKKHAKPVIDICKQIQTNFHNKRLFWYRGYPYKSIFDFTKAEDYYAYRTAKYCIHENRVLLYKCVKKAHKDKFPIQDYFIGEIVNSNNKYFVYFYNKENRFNKTICFLVKDKAIPHKRVNGNLVPQKNCQEAVCNVLD